jgi:aerobic C4-dicarboxylate transport protein
MTQQSANTTSQGDRPPAKRDRSARLYLFVIVGVAAGIAVGLLAPSVGKELKPLGTGFVNLVKMLITPIIFCTIVLGIGSVRSAAKVGKVGGLALLYFLVMSTAALAIGLVVGNLIKPGAGIAVTQSIAEKGTAQATGGGRIAGRLRPRHHPDHLLLRLHQGRGAAGAVRRPAGRLRGADPR